jgi:hypothetical protein
VICSRFFLQPLAPLEISAVAQNVYPVFFIFFGEEWAIVLCHYGLLLPVVTRFDGTPGFLGYLHEIALMMALLFPPVSCENLPPPLILNQNHFFFLLPLSRKL